MEIEEEIVVALHEAGFAKKISATSGNHFKLDTAEKN